MRRAGRLASQLAGVLISTTVLVSGCVMPDFGTPRPETRTPVPATTPAKPPPPSAVVRPVPELPPSAPGTVEPVPPPNHPAPTVSAASQALITQSRGHQAAGHYEQAAASIERALRIEPRQPVLWLELGNIRLKEGDYAQAEGLGRKALSLSTGDAVLTSRAEQLIVAAKKR